MRALNLYELQILSKAIGAKNSSLSNILHTLSVEQVGEEDLDFYHVRLHYSGRPWRGGGYSVIADWVGDDADGAIISLLALGDEDDYIYEIEIRRLDTQPLQRLPLIDDWRQA